MHRLIFILILSLLPASTFANEDISWYETHFSERLRERIQEQFDGFFERIRLPSDKNPPKIVLFENNGRSLGYVKPSIPDTVFINSLYYSAETNDGPLIALFAHELRHLEPDQRARNHKHARTQDEIEASLEAMVTRLLRVGLFGPDGNPEPAAVDFESVLNELEKERSSYSDHYLTNKDEVIFLRTRFAKERTRRKFPKRNKPLDPSLQLEVLNALSSPEVSAKKSEEKQKTRKKKSTSKVRRDALRTAIQAMRSPIDQLKYAVAEAIKSPNDEAHNEIDFVLRTHFQDDLNRNEAPKWRHKFNEFPRGFFTTLAENHPGARSEWEELGKLEALLTNDSADIHDRSGIAFLNYTLLAGPKIFSEKLLQREKSRLFELAKEDPEKLLHIAGSPLFQEKWQERKTGCILAKALKKIPADVLKNLSERSDNIPRGLASLPQRTLKRFPTHVLRNLAQHYRKQGLWNESEEISRSNRTLYAEHVKAAQSENEMEHIFSLLEDEDSTRPYQRRLLNKAAVHALKNGGVEKEAAEINRLRWNKDPDSLRVKVNAAIASDKSQRLPLHEHLKSLPDYDATGVYSILHNKNSSFTRRVSTDMLVVYARSPRFVKKALYQHFLRYPLDTISALASRNRDSNGFPYKRFLRDLPKDQLLNALLLKPPSPPEGHEQLLLGISNEIVKRMKAGKLTTQEEVLALRRLAHLSQVTGKQGATLIKLVESRIHNTKSVNERLHYQASLTPQNFPHPRAYIEWSQSFFKDLTSDLAPKFAKDRQKNLGLFVKQIKKAQKHLDPLTRRSNLLTVAEAVRATPDEKERFKWSHGVRDESIGEGIAHAKAYLEAFRQLDSGLQWRAIEWLRGKEQQKSIWAWNAKKNDKEETAFKTIRERIRQGLANKGVIVSEEEVLTTFRTVYDSFSPLGRSLFIQLALGGNDGLLERYSVFPGLRNNREGIERTILSEFPKGIRHVSKELFDAAVYAFPKGFDLILLSIALAESGKSGTPEEALRMIFQNQGGLVKKFGQMLAFETRLPESYRRELQKLWDEVPAPDWWTVLRLIAHQKGNIWESGYEVVRIANSGTTEILVEVRDPKGKSLMLSVQHEGVKAGADTDFSDMKRFLTYLHDLPKGKERYGFMRLLLRDSARTMRQELNPRYKERITPLARKSYAHAGTKLGGQPSENGLFEIKGWHFDTAKFVKQTLDDGTEVTLQEKAAGIPLKDLKRSHPRLYKQLAPVLLAIENEVQNTTRLIDKDRMPGQILVDPETKKVTFLDFGQAKKVSADSLKFRDRFIGATLVNNRRRLHTLLRNLGIELNKDEMKALQKDLKTAPAGARPLAALNWLDLNKKFEGDTRQAFFWDLVHVVRAKTRLAQWGETDKVRLVRKEWKALAKENMSLKQLAGACLGMSP